VIYLPGDEVVARRGHVVLERSGAKMRVGATGALSQLDYTYPLYRRLRARRTVCDFDT
jgi:hypothetical protein